MVFGIKSTVRWCHCPVQFYHGLSKLLRLEDFHGEENMGPGAEWHV